MTDRLWLIGMMGSGKSTVGGRIARSTGVDHLDTDEIVVDRAGMSIPELFETVGVAAFRDLEHQAVLEAAQRRGVVSTGGGAVIDPRNRDAMRRSGTVVHLSARPPTLASRTGSHAGRPLLDDGDAVEVLARLTAERQPMYAETAHHVVEVDALGIDEVAGRVEALWNAS